MGNKKIKNLLGLVVVVCLLMGIILIRTFSGLNADGVKPKTNSNRTRTSQLKYSKKSSAKKLTTSKSHKKAKPSVMRTPISWRASSETVPYPNVNKYPNLWIHVSIEKQRMYLMNNNQALYTMYASTGVQTPDRATPTGTYYVQAERGYSFYNSRVGEGAYYWVSWLNHGEYLFHSTPTDAQGNYIQSDANDLGKKPSSHGCVHLSVSDSKWVYENIKYGTKVVID
ncbi:MAG: L,D-transpeptidase [Liquorilactobacillus ghanensis]|uniref:L,D-transpeptidase n=1 Tax=Liquorilactobacillus ghanensis TaxID=399370 RepID=UPI0039EA7077